MGHGREGNTHPQGLSFPLSDRIHRAFSHIAHKRRNVRFNRLRRVHTPPRLLTVHTAAYAAKHGAFWIGGGSHYPRSVLRGSETLRGRVSERSNFAAFGSWSGVLPKNVESLRNSDALMRVAVPRRRGPAGLRDPIAVSLTALIGFTVLADRDYRVRKKAHFVFMHRAALPALPAPSAALLYALMH